MVFHNCFLQQTSEGLLKTTEELQTEVHSITNIHLTPHIWHMLCQQLSGKQSLISGMLIKPSS